MADGINKGSEKEKSVGGRTGDKQGEELQRSVQASYDEAMSRAYDRARGGQDYSDTPPTAAPISTGTAGKGNTES